MKMTRQERSRAVFNVHENRAVELATAVIAILKERGEVNYPAIADAIVAVATERFRRYDK